MEQIDAQVNQKNLDLKKMVLASFCIVSDRYNFFLICCLGVR